MHVNVMAEQYDFGTMKAISFIIFNERISENVEGGLRQRKVDLKTVKQYARPSNRRCVVEVLREYMRCIPGSVEDFTESPFRTERQEMSDTGHRLLE